MLKQNGHQQGDQATSTSLGRTYPFGTTVDPVEAGRRGGQASGVSRRRHPLRLLQQRILESSNGAAALGLRKEKQRQDRALEREVIARDKTVLALMDEEERLGAEIAAERQRRDARRAEVDALEQRKTELRQRLESDDAIAAWLDQTRRGAGRACARVDRLA
jgi:hypothetical protein